MLECYLPLLFAENRTPSVSRETVFFLVGLKNLALLFLFTWYFKSLLTFEQGTRTISLHLTGSKEELDKSHLFHDDVEILLSLFIVVD